DGEVEGAGGGDGDAVGNRWLGAHRNGVACRERKRVGRCALSLHPDDAQGTALLGELLLHGTRDPGREPATTDGHDDGVNIGHLVENLEAEGSLADDDVV